MSLASVKAEVLSQLPPEETARGEILFNNCACQILSQSAVSIDFLVDIANETEPVEYSLLIDSDQEGIFGMAPKVKDKNSEMGPLFLRDSGS